MPLPSPGYRPEAWGMPTGTCWPTRAWNLCRLRSFQRGPMAMTPTCSGGSAMNGVTTEQLRWPGSALLLAADLIHRVHDAETTGGTGVDVGLAIAYGLELGASTTSPLLAQRWEEGWHRPLAEWREELGIAALVARSPFAA